MKAAVRAGARVPPRPQKGERVVVRADALVSSEEPRAEMVREN